MSKNTEADNQHATDELRKQPRFCDPSTVIWLDAATSDCADQGEGFVGILLPNVLDESTGGAALLIESDSAPLLEVDQEIWVGRNEQTRKATVRNVVPVGNEEYRVGIEWQTDRQSE